MVTLYNVISSDGYIARKDGSEDFIPDELWSTTLNTFKKFDILVMGRKTYEAMQNYDKNLLNPFERLDIKKVVVTRNKNLMHKPGYVIVHTPEDAIRMGENILISSGPNLNNYFLEKKLIDRIIFHQLPSSIGDGIQPFDDKYKKDFTLKSETQLEKVEELTYELSK